MGTKKCYAYRLRGFARLDNLGLVFHNDFAFDVIPPISYKDASEIVDFLEKEYKLPKPRKIKKVGVIFGEDGRGSETIELEIGEKVRVVLDIYYYTTKEVGER